MGSNTLIFGSDLVMFLQVNEQQVTFGPYLESTPPLFTLLLIPQAWTLALELLFYLLAPWLVRQRTFTLIFLMTISLSLKIFVVGLILQAQDPWLNRFFGFEISYFLLGILLFRYWLARRAQWTANCSHNRSVGDAIVVSLIILAAPWLRTFADSFGFFIGHYAVTLLIVLSLASLIPRLFMLTSTSKLDRKIGEFSYPVYLSHILALGLLGVLVSRIYLSPLITFVCALALIFAIAFGIVLFARRLGPIRDRVREHS